MEIKTIGYKFRIVNSSVLYEVVSKTELDIENSGKIIKDFFNNFRILRSEVIKGLTVDVFKNQNETKEIFNEKVSNDIKITRKKRDSIKNIWKNIKDLLNDEFTRKEYGGALIEGGYKYSKNSLRTASQVHTKKLVETNKIEKIENSDPIKYKKITVPSSLKDNKELEKLSKSLKESKIIELATHQEIKRI